MIKGKSAYKHGSVLILAIWTLLILALFVSSVGFAVRNHLTAISRFEIRDELRLIAHSGIEKTLYFLARDQKNEVMADYLGEAWSSNLGEFKEIKMGRGLVSIFHKNGQSVTYGAVDEQSKLNLNRITDVTVLQRLLAGAANLSEADALAIAAGILDWKDQDDDVRPQGAESDFYRATRPPYRCKNLDFNVLDELLFVKGVTYQVFDAIKPYLTLSTDGKLNLNTASVISLKAVGLENSLAQKVIQYRVGNDQTEQTADDRFFNDLETAAQNLKMSLGLSEDEETQLNNLISSNILTTFSDVFSISAEAHLERRRERIRVDAIADKSGRIRSWHEVFQAL